MQTPVHTNLIRLAAIPIVVALVIGLLGCATIILQVYGIDLLALLPFLPKDFAAGAPLILFGSAMMGLTVTRQAFENAPPGDGEPGVPDTGARPFTPSQKRFILFWLFIMLLALMTLPYWLGRSYPELFVLGGIIFAIVAYIKLSVEPEQP